MYNCKWRMNKTHLRLVLSACIPKSRTPIRSAHVTSSTYMRLHIPLIRSSNYIHHHLHTRTRPINSHLRVAESVCVSTPNMQPTDTHKTHPSPHLKSTTHIHPPTKKQTLTHTHTQPSHTHTHTHPSTKSTSLPHMQLHAPLPVSNSTPPFARTPPHAGVVAQGQIFVAMQLCMCALAFLGLWYVQTKYRKWRKRQMLGNSLKGLMRSRRDARLWGRHTGADPCGGESVCLGI